MNQVGADEEARSIACLVGRSWPGVSAVRVSGLTQVFGGNARKARAFELAFVRQGREELLPCIILSQLGGRQVESDVAREFRILRGLEGKGVRVPRAIAVDESGQTVGAPSIVLERLPGSAGAVELLRSQDVAASRSVIEDLSDVVAQLHSVDWEPGAFDPSLARLSPRDLAQRQIAHWQSTFESVRLDPNPVMSSLFGWLHRHLPEPSRVSLVHGDLRPGNFLYQGQRVTGLLDWEMAHLGDPIEDLGWIYRPFWSPRRLVELKEFTERYRQQVRFEVPWTSVIYYRIFSELKFATISLTAAKAFVEGQARNMRHADRAATVAPCLRRSLEWRELFYQEAARV